MNSRLIAAIGASALLLFSVVKGWPAAAPSSAAAAIRPANDLASQVTIRRDRFGVPIGAATGEYGAFRIVACSTSDDPNSKHHTDQSALFAQEKWKRAWFTEEEIARNLERSYKP